MAARIGTAFALAVAALATFAGARELAALEFAGRARASLLETRVPRLAAARDAWVSAALAARAWPPDDALTRLEVDALVAVTDALLAARAPASAPSAAAVRALERARSAVRAVPRRSANRQREADARAAMARVARAAGDGGEGPEIVAMSAAFDEAAALAPADGLLLVDRARAELSLGLAGPALATAKRIARLYPEVATGHALAAAAFLQGGDRAAAREALGRAIAARWEEGSEAQRREAERLFGLLGGLADSSRGRLPR